jgi:hypothetical protein
VLISLSGHGEGKTVHDLRSGRPAAFRAWFHIEREEIPMSTITLPKAVQDFVTTTNSHDGDALFAVFAPGATVVDDGTTYATASAVREWIKVHQVDPKVVITPTSFDANRLVASVDGDFPGGPLVFAFSFTTGDDRITSLSIELA